MRTRKLLAIASMRLGVAYGMVYGVAYADDTIKLPEITVISHYDNAVGTSDSASQGVVTSSLIQNRPALRTGEVLEFIPGMIVTQHSGDGKANQYFLRGFNLDHGTDFATYVDEVPSNMRTHAHGQGYTDLNFLIPELVSRIDYKKGPYFADEGDFSSAGAAHLQLANQLPQGIASVSLGGGGYQRYLLANSMDAQRGTLLYGLEVGRNNGPWDTSENLRKYNGVLRYSEGHHDQGFNITAMAYKNTWRSTDQIPQRAVDAGLLSRYGTVDPMDGGESTRYSLAYAMRQRGADKLFELNAYAVQSSLDLYSNFTYFLNNSADGDQFNQSERRKMYGLNAAQTWFTTFAGLEMENKIGVQSRYDKLAPIGLYSSIAQQRTATTREDEVKQGSIGLYAENATQWRPWFRTVAGIRYDSYRFKVNSSIEGNSGTAHDHVSSPKLSFIFGPWAKTEYFINYGKGFHSNDARGTTQTKLPNGGGASSPVTPLVGTRGSEIGLRTEIVPGLQSSLAVWQLQIDSELVFIGDAGETQASRASYRQGLEWNNHYIAKPGLLFDVDVAVSKARYRGDDPAGNYIPGALNKVLSFGATITDSGPWFGSFHLRYFGPRPLIEDNSVQSKSTTLAYARLGYQFAPKTRITADIFNLFNRQASDIDYLYESRLRTDAASMSDIHFHPVEPRTLRLTLTQHF